jgi:ectoine hydroxylase-related dioxygenase (phytanoyl-CoA dioxygenase family)
VIHERDPDGVLVSDKLVQPELEYPELVEAPFFATARTMAAQALRARRGAESILMFLSKPGGAPPTPWHQDENTRPPHIAEQVTFWMPLEPVDDRNGTLAFVPDSHRGQMIPHDAYCTIPDGVVDEARAMTCALAPGDAILIHGRVVHGATANRTRRRRRVAFIYFFRLAATASGGRRPPGRSRRRAG